MIAGARASSQRTEAHEVRVVVCDDSAVIRAYLARMLESDPAVRVVARVANGQLALEAIKREPADVILLDIEMPVMDGLTALPRLLEADPALRVIIASSLTTRGAEIALRALKLGASDYIPKPGGPEAAGTAAFRDELLAKVKGLARLRRSFGSRAGESGTIQLRPAPPLSPRLLAIGSSTGGPQALFTLVQALGARVRVPVVLTQHMPATFTPILADHIDRLGALPCREAVDGEILHPGRIYVAPGDRHLLVQESAGVLRARLSSDPPENYCRPSVDPMLRTAAQACSGRVLVAMLTGMGHDGLAGTRQVIGMGGVAVAQNEATSVVWGMPGAIARAGLCNAVLPLPSLAAKLTELLRMERA